MTADQRTRWMELVREWRTDMGISNLLGGQELNDEEILYRTNVEVAAMLWLAVKQEPEDIE